MIQVEFALTDEAKALREQGIDVTPQRKTSGAACFDLCAVRKGIIGRGRVGHIPVGVVLKIPEGYEGVVRSRSGLSKKGRIVVHGTIDADYRGEIGVCLFNTCDDLFTFNPGDRVAQLAIRPVPQVDLVEVPVVPVDTERGTGGFGSTGR